MVPLPIFARCFAAALILAPVHQATAQSSPRDTAFPATGLDFSGVDRFWALGDILVRDREPAAAQWDSLLSTPAYRLVLRNLSPGLRDDIDLALRPSRHAEFVRATQGGSDHSLALQHLAAAYARRVELRRYRDSLVQAAPIAEAIAKAQHFLPAGATTNGQPPLVTFAFFRDDGYSLPEGIVVDLLYARVLALGGVPLTLNLGHEFHHSYVNRMSRTPPPDGMASGEGALRDALYFLRNEGLADLIDKPVPFTSPAPGLVGYAARYNVEYARTPSVVSRLDSLLAGAAGDTAALAAVGDRAMGLFWSNGHPNGAYIAREILQTFGVDSLFPAAYSPAAFLRTYGWAERKLGRPAPFSPQAMRELAILDRRYWER